ncbi:MAG: DUF3379 domain-containing protein [Chromatiaceae bacterium]|jgi:hypothetical protein|nr:DUF3379 domain-containing protein [Chromatiaceae bacterium]
MNCEAFRRQLLIDPYCRDALFWAHARVCPECASAVDEALRFEKRLRALLSAELTTAGDREARWSVARGPVTRYALLVLPLLLAALLFGLGFGLRLDASRDLADLVIAHILAEEEHLRAKGTIPHLRLQSLFRLVGADVDPSIGEVSFAGLCVVGDGKGVHLVVPGNQGAVTALFMPGNAAPAEQEIAGAGLVGTILSAGLGSVAIIGRPGESLEPVARRLLGAVRWDQR